jgi:hypothetical protein
VTDSESTFLSHLVAVRCEKLHYSRRAGSPGTQRLSHCHPRRDSDLGLDSDSGLARATTQGRVQVLSNQENRSAAATTTSFLVPLVHHKPQQMTRRADQVACHVTVQARLPSHLVLLDLLLGTAHSSDGVDGLQPTTQPTAQAGRAVTQTPPLGPG